MNIKIAVPDKIISPEILQAALETATRANEGILAGSDKIPSVKDAIRRGVRWRPEPPGTGESLDLAPTIVDRGWGDCDDLAPWLAAEMRKNGDRGARAIAVRSGPRKWHAIVEDGAGVVHDPSRWAGMRGKVSVDGDPQIETLALPGQRAFALVPVGDNSWSARVDLPSRKHNLHASSIAHAKTPEKALLRAARNAANYAPSQARELGLVINGLCGVAEEDPEQMGFLGDLVKGVANIVSDVPIVGNVVKGVAQAASPLVSTVSKIASPLSPIVSAINPALGLGMQALPLGESLLATLARGGKTQGPVAQAQIPRLPSTPVSQNRSFLTSPSAALPFPVSPDLLATIAYLLTGGGPSPIVARW